MKRVVWSEVGALTSSGMVVATIFCCLPFATGVIGATLAAVGARFEPFRPYLVAASLLLLGQAFYGAYRAEPSCARDGCDEPRVVRHRRAMVWVVAALVLLFVTAQWWANWVIYWTL